MMPMDGNMIVRPATVDDAYELARLNTAFNGGREAPEHLARRLADPRRVETSLVAEIDQRVVGFASLRLVPCVFYAEPRAELTELFVEVAHRRRGIGHALVAYAERLAMEGEAKELFVLTGFENQAAQALYRAMGYRDYDLAMCKEFGK